MASEQLVAAFSLDDKDFNNGHEAFSVLAERIQDFIKQGEGRLTVESITISKLYKWFGALVVYRSEMSQD